MFDLFMLPEGHKLSLCIIRNFSAIIYDASELKLVASAYSLTVATRSRINSRIDR